MAWRGRAKKGHGADLVKPEVLEMNEEVCGGVRTLQITAKRGLDAEEDSTTARSAPRASIYTCCRCEPQPRGTRGATPGSSGYEGNGPLAARSPI